jgi:uncharacterized protein YbjT (DUF2867 family)
MIAVMGAAGNVGGKVADLLLRAGEDVRVLEHQRSLEELAAGGAEVVHGDAREAGDLASLFDGADAALVLLPDNVAEEKFVATRSAVSRALAEALRRRPVGHVVALSSVGVDRPDVPGIPAGLREFEQRLLELEQINLLVLRSAFYMDYLLANVPLIRAQGINGSALGGDLPISMIATQDVAAEAAERLARRDFAGHETKVLRGPADVTMREATRALGERLGLAELQYVQFPPDDLKGALLGSGMSNEAASLLVAMQLGQNAGHFRVSDELAPAVTKQTRLEDFLDEAFPVSAQPSG